jgi:hypothetical protein
MGENGWLALSIDGQIIFRLESADRLAGALPYNAIRLSRAITKPGKGMLYFFDKNRWRRPRANDLRRRRVRDFLNGTAKDDFGGSPGSNAQIRGAFFRGQASLRELVAAVGFQPANFTVGPVFIARRRFRFRAGVNWRLVGIDRGLNGAPRPFGIPLDRLQRRPIGLAPREHPHG